jgi:nucleotide-binding universal stress UspA family protein
MISRVLVAMDGSEMSEEALRYAMTVYSGAEITVLTVVGEPSPMMGQATAIAAADDPQAKAEELASPVVDRARELAAEHDVEIETSIGFGHPAREIVTRAEAFDAVVLGSHSGSVADNLIIGNVAATVFKHSPVPVTTVR